MATEVPVRRLGLLGVGLGMLAGLSLAYELILIRILGWVHYPQFAGMIISLALLGYGLSGTILALRRRQRGSHRWIIGGALLFSLAMPLCTDLAMAIPFNGLELTWDWRQLLYLGAVFALLSLPFFFAATAIGLTLIRHPAHVGPLYGADLAGAGIGAVLALGLAAWVALPQAVLTLSALGIAPVLALAWGLERKPYGAAAGLVVAWVVVAYALEYPGIEPSQFKPLSQTMAAKGARKSAEAHGPLGVITVVDNTEIPIRIAPGLSVLAGTGPPARQSALFIDATDMAGLDRPGADASYLRAMSSALAYELGATGRVLVLNAGGGQPVRQALAGGAGAVDVTVTDPRLAALYRDHTAWADGHAVRLHRADPRHFLETAQSRWDLIVWDSALAPGRPGALGLEDYLLTVEATETALGRLTEDGVLSLTVPLEVPPRAAVKLLWTAVAALEKTGETNNPLARMLMIRSWNTATLLIGRRPFGKDDADAAAEFVRRLGFDLAWGPGIAIDDVNRRMKWDQPWLYRAAQALATGEHGYLQSYPFEVRPASDDRPYFRNYFRWGLVPQLVEQRREGGLMLLEMGYLLVLATLLQAVCFGAVLMLVPLFAGGGRLRHTPGLARWTLYFGAVGVGFMGIEIAFIQKLHLLFANPVQAIGVALSGFLAFAGIGGLTAARAGMMRPAAVGIAVLCAVYGFGLDLAVLPALGWPEPARLALALGLTAPLAFLMGIPFPVGLSALAHRDRRSAAWVWGVNGCASVIAAPLAVLLAMAVGFRWILVTSAVLYLVAGLAFRRN